MSTHEPSDGADSGLGPAPASAPGVGTRPGRRAWALAVVAAIAAGVGSWAVVEGALLAYKPVFESASKPYPTAEDNVRIARARVVSGTLAYGATGGLLGLALGLAGGASRRSIGGAAVAGMAGLVLGGLGEAGAAYPALSYIYTSMDMQADDMLQTLLSHEALWAVVGLAGGLAFGLGLGKPGAWWKTAVGGLAGAALATVAYEFIGALGFPTHGTHQPYGDSATTRALAQVLITLGSAIGAASAAGDRPRKPAGA